MNHFSVQIDNRSQITDLLAQLFSDVKPKGFEALDGLQGRLFSGSVIENYIDQEERHGIKTLNLHTSQSLKSMSSGEQKKALLYHVLSTSPGFLVLVNPFDHLDVTTRAYLKETLLNISKEIILVQLVSRIEDILPFTTLFFRLNSSDLIPYQNAASLWKANQEQHSFSSKLIPKPLRKSSLKNTTLVSFKKVSVHFNGKPVLQDITWQIKKGEFWHLTGPNGSGKSTLLTMITGDSHKGYGQNLTLFGNRKGSGESVWDIKQHIGYFTPAMDHMFKGYHSLKNMLISGFHDSIGLYVHPSDSEKNLAQQWLELIHLQDKKDTHFHNLSLGEKRLLMVARAMIKHPPLLILDEPTTGLDDSNAKLFITLVNKLANETDTTILFVSHRAEIGLKPKFTYQLQMTPKGSIGKIV